MHRELLGDTYRFLQRMARHHALFEVAIQHLRIVSRHERHTWVVVDNQKVADFLTSDYSHANFRLPPTRHLSLARKGCVRHSDSVRIRRRSLSNYRPCIDCHIYPSFGALSEPRLDFRRGHTNVNIVTQKANT